MRTYIIAEAGVNHNGSIDMARQLVDAAAKAGADAVKFQTFRAESLVTMAAPKAAYQKDRTGGNSSQFAMLKQLELDEHAHLVLTEYCRQREIDFLSTPFDAASARFLVETVRVPRMKIPSGELTNGPLILQIATYQKPVILSTGMSTLEEIKSALGVLAFGFTRPEAEPGKGAFDHAYESKAGQQALRESVTLLHCTTAYPTPIDEINLRAMDTLRTSFGLPVGWSDHSEGIRVAPAAVARGAVMIEKHITLDRALPGPDHRASIEPQELEEMVRTIRLVESALGEGGKEPTRSELQNRDVARKSLVAGEDIAEGALFTAQNLTTKRPGTGLSPMLYWSFLGTRATRAFQKDELIS